MAVASNVSTGGTTPPVVIDGAGLTTTVPLLIKNGKTLSGVEVQVTGTAASGFVLRDSGGTLQGQVGLAVSASDWTTNSAANDVVIGAASGHLILKATGATKGVKIWSPNNTGTNAFFLFVDDSTGVKMGFGTVNTLLFDSARASMTGPLSIDNSNSLTNVRLQFSGDANTGIGQIGGADTLGLVANGVEVARAGADFLISPAGALATTATTGFLGIPTCAGAPTGAAANGSLIYDSTNFKIYVRTAGAWKSTAVLT